MGSCWDLICNAADFVAWMSREGFGPERYEVPETYPFLIGNVRFGGATDGSWMIVDVSDARRLVVAAGQVVLEHHDT